MLERDSLESRLFPLRQKAARHRAEGQPARTPGRDEGADAERLGQARQVESVSASHRTFPGSTAAFPADRLLR